LTRACEAPVTAEFYGLDGDEWAAICLPVDGIELPFLSIQTTRDPQGATVIIGRGYHSIQRGPSTD